MTIFANFFLGNIGQENAFYDILKRKKAFVGYKNDKFKKSKNWHFSKSLTHGFGPKIPTISTFFRKYRPGKCLLRYSKTKKGLSRVKKKHVQKVEKIGIFPKGLAHGFRPNMAIFSTFFWGNIGQKNVFYDILERKKAFLGYKSNNFKKSKKLTFFQRG